MKKRPKVKKSLPLWAKWTIFSVWFLVALALIGVLVWQLVLKHVA